MKRLGEIASPDNVHHLPAVHEPARSSETLAERDPREIDRGLQDRLAELCGGNLIVNASSRFSADGGTFSHATVDSVRWQMPDEARPIALDLLRRVLRPATDQRMMDALYRLRIGTVGRGEGDNDGREAEVQVWLEWLRQFPADVVIHTIREWPKRQNGKFWPTWHELEKILSARASFRFAIRAKLERQS